jgi:hypothetical protein
VNPGNRNAAQERERLKTRGFRAIIGEKGIKMA